MKDIKSSKEEIKGIIEKHGMYLSPELQSFSMHASSVDKLAKAILKYINNIIEDCEQALKQAVDEACDEEQIKRIIINKELTPSICEDSGQAEWSEGEAQKLAIAISQHIRGCFYKESDKR